MAIISNTKLLEAIAVKKIIIPLVVVIVTAGSIFGLNTYKKSESYRTQKEIADNIIRFHVRANSDSDADQALKLKVKDAVVTYLQRELSDAAGIDEARKILYDDSARIEAIADDVIKSEGMAYDVNVYFETSYFPMKTYGDMTFPPGEYEAFRIDIGDAQGHNWWCVLFPPLCLVEQSYSVVPDDSKEQLKGLLSDEAYDTITMQDLDEDEYEVRFKYLTFLNKLFD